MKVQTQTSSDLNWYLRWLSIKLRWFGNSLSLKINFQYFLHHSLCKLRSRGLKYDKRHRELARELETVGMVNAGVTDVSQIARWTSEYFAKNPAQAGFGTVKRSEAGELAEDIFRAIQNSVSPVLNAHYGSHFQCYWISIFRYETGGHWTAASSFGYHLDDNPAQLLKIFFYLNDTYESNSAFRAFDYHTSKELFRKGFISCSAELRVNSQRFVTEQLEKERIRIMEGVQGTALIFDNNLVHKGTPPREGYRDVVAIEVYPSDRPIDVESIRKGLTVPFQKDYPLNPFKNDLLASPGPR
jgi:hypothetical protein